VKAVILAAGLSSRLRAVCGARPKCLLEVGGAPILRRTLDHLAACGVGEVAIVAGFGEAHVRDALAAWKAAAHVVVNERYASTNNAFSLLQARPVVDGGPFVLLDGDIVFEREVLQRLVASTHENRLALRPTSDLGDEEMKCRLDDRGRVLEISKTVPAAAAAGESIGIECFSGAASAQLFDVLARRMADAALRNEYYEASFQELIDRGTALHAVAMRGLRCVEIDTPADLAAADALMRAPT
jgi:choline kinase